MCIAGLGCYSLDLCNAVFMKGSDINDTNARAKTSRALLPVGTLTQSHTSAPTVEQCLPPLASELYVIPLDESRYIIYAPLGELPSLQTERWYEYCNR